jgi:hypothetical protein
MPTFSPQLTTMLAKRPSHDWQITDGSHVHGLYTYREGKSFCAQRFLHDIDAKDILILCCLALESSKYEQRST